MDKGERICWLDALRGLSACGIVMLHVASFSWHDLAPDSCEWAVINVYHSSGLTRAFLVLFVMISGALLLRSDSDMRSFNRRHIPRLAAAYFSWSIFFALAKAVKRPEMRGFEAVILNIFNGHFHLWFIPMLIALYICTPILRRIARDENLTKLFLTFSFVTSFVLPEIIYAARDIAGGGVAADILSVFRERISSGFSPGYAAYFIFGYWLSEIHIGRKMRRILYAAGILCAVLPAVLTHAASVSAGRPVSQYITYFSPFVAVTAAAVFILFRYLAEESGTAAKIFSSQSVRRFSDMTFGIYMIHPITYVALDKFLHINILSFEPMLSVPVITLLSIAMSLAATAVIRRIPVLGRYIV